MKRLWILLLAFTILVYLTGCASTKTVLYEGVLENIATAKSTTTITFADNVVVTNNYNDNYNPEGALIFGDSYKLVDTKNWIAENIYLERVIP